MTARCRFRIAVVTILVASLLTFLVDTGCKYVLNSYESAVSKSDNDLPAQTIGEARKRGSLTSELTCTPCHFVVDGSPIVIGECWVEQRTRREPHLVWF